MAFAFDTLSYARRLESAGVDRKQAEAHAEAARDFIMAELVTKSDLKAALDAQALKFALMIGGSSVAIVGTLATLIKLSA